VADCGTPPSMIYSFPPIPWPKDDSGFAFAGLGYLTGPRSGLTSESPMGGLYRIGPSTLPDNPTADLSGETPSLQPRSHPPIHMRHRSCLERGGAAPAAWRYSPQSAALESSRMTLWTNN
jgi:hypothetical protein